VPPLAHLNLTVADIERSQAFYARWFGFDLAFHPGAPPSPPAPTVHFGFRANAADEVRSLVDAPVPLPT
jgi:catechol 2,3-dioxygenase-like lactoylglutathione lyase family enzyme